MAATLRKVLLLSTLVASTALLGACMHWQELAPLTPSQGTALVLDSNQTYRFTLHSGDTLVVHGAHVEADSVVWSQPVSAGTYWVPQRRTIPISSIRGESIERADVGGTVLGLVGFALALGALVGVA